MSSFSAAHVRHYLLAYHGLTAAHRLQSADDALAFVRKVGCIQYDPLNVVGTNPELVLQSRWADFRPVHLQQWLYRDRALIDGWDKNMAIYPVEDWPAFEHGRQHARCHPRLTQASVLEALPTVMAAIRQRGPLTTQDITLNDKVDWAWAPAPLARAALEALFFRGDVVVAQRQGSRRSFELAERWLPDPLRLAPDPHGGDDEKRVEWAIRRRIASVGLLWNRASDAWLAIRDLTSARRQRAFDRLIACGTIRPLQVDGIRDPLFIPAEAWPLLSSLAATTGGPEPHAALLAPLDNLMWDRKLIHALYDFEYLWEVYKPVAQRRWGYYVLPVIANQRFVARVEPVLDRSTATLHIRNWWWQPECTPSDQDITALQAAFRRFADFCQADHIRLAPGLSRRHTLSWLSRA